VVGYTVSVELSSPRRVLPGMTATAEIVHDEHENVLVVPNRAITRQGRERFVQVVGTDGAVESRKVELGLADDRVTEVTSGVAEGEELVLPVTTARAELPGRRGGQGAVMFGGAPGGRSR
jgi:multidrug efflux pump subunit AcrA (membrane-fusion protein)